MDSLHTAYKHQGMSEELPILTKTVFFLNFYPFACKEGLTMPVITFAREEEPGKKV